MLTAKPNAPSYVIKGYTWAQLQRCVEREMGLRRRRYRNRVLTGRMKPHHADIEIDMMRVIAEHLAELAAKERLL